MNRYRFCPCLTLAYLLILMSLCYHAVAQKDSVVVPVSLKYSHPSIFKKFFLGENYRREWAQPVKMPVFHLQSTMGGFKIDKMGGGHQTKSLQIVSLKDGKEWVLRTLDKDVTKVLPKKFRHGLVKNIAQDMVSAAHPYAPITVGELSKALRITAPSPHVYYMPDDAALGEYRKDMADKVVMLEERYPRRHGADHADMEDLMPKMKADNSIIILQKEILRVRMLDLIIADWDRHQRQWKWSTYDSAGRQVYCAIPVDRDQAFFRSKGALVKFASTFFTPFLKGFKPKLKHPKTLTRWNHDFDRVFLNQLSAEDWEDAIGETQALLTDSVIDAACHQLPPEIYAIRGEWISLALKIRRNGLHRAAMRYYKFLSKKVYIIATDKKEIVQVTNVDGSPEITIYNGDRRDATCMVYHRRFESAYTKKIYLVGFDANDKIEGMKLVRGRVKITPEADDGGKEYNVRQRVYKRLIEKK